MVLSKYIKQIILCIVLAFFPLIVFSQNTIKGVVCDPDNRILCDANVVLSHNDSIVAHTVSQVCGFSLENVHNGIYTLIISYVGYEEERIKLELNDNIDLGNIKLKSGSNIIDEVIVKSSIKISNYKNGTLDVSVKNTALSELPNIESLLSNLPGILSVNGGFSYFGNKQILFLINGREVKSAEELNLLQPSQIQKISINNMPGAKYDSQYSAVIDIKTSLDKPALMVYNNDTWGRNFSFGSGITSQIRTSNNFIFDVSYGIRNRKNTLYTEQFEKNLHAENHFERNIIDTLFSDRMSHDWGIGAYREFDKSTLGIKYSGFYSTNSPEYNSTFYNKTISENEHWNVSQFGKYKEFQNMLSLDYLVKLTSKDHLNITTDYLYREVSSNSSTSESSMKSEENKNTYDNFNGKNNIYSFLSEYEHSFNDSIKFNLGFRYSYVHNDDNSEINKNKTLYGLKENRYAMYSEWNFNWKRILLYVGVRCELFDKKYKYNEQQTMNYRKIFFLPSFSVSYSPSNNIQISLSGNNKVSLPSFNELTPITTYLNQYSYSTGNPFLHPTIGYDLGMDITLFKKFQLDLEYNYLKNDRISYCVPDESNIHALKYSYTNIAKSEQYLCMMTYSDNLFSRHNINLTLGVSIPHTRIPYMDGYLYRNKPSVLCQLYTNWKIGKMINFSISYAFQSKSFDKADVFSPTHNLGCILSITPIKDRLFISLQANDILRKSYGNWTSNYGYITTSQFNNADSRSFVFSIRYTFKSFKRTIERTSNIEERERL